MKRLITIFVLSLFLIDSVALDSSDAYAGVLSRGNNQINIRVPKIRNRNVKTQTSVQRKTMPPIEYRDTPVTDQYARMVKNEYKYQKKLHKWERKKIRIEQRAARKAERLARKAERQREKELRAKQRKAGTTAQPGGKADPSVAHDPTSWFSQKIAMQKKPGPTQSLRNENKQNKKLLSSDQQPKEEQRDKELDLGQKKKSSFWTHVLRALGL